MPKNTQFYKGTNYFYDTTEINKPYFWVGNVLEAMGYARRYQGGLMVYKNIDDLNLFIFTPDNIRRIYKTIDDPKVKQAFQLKFGLDMSRNKHIQMILNHTKWDDVIWLYNTRYAGSFMYCKTPIYDETYWNRANDYIIHDYMINYLEPKGFHGTITFETFSPFMSHVKEDVVIFKTDRFVLDSANPYYWKNWFPIVSKKYNVVLPKSFDLAQGISNNCFKTIKYYNKYTPTSRGFRSPIGHIKNLKQGISVITYNVHGFISINALVTEHDMVKSVRDLIETYKPNIMFLQEVPFSSVYAIRELGYKLIHTPNGGHNLCLCALVDKEINYKIVHMKYNKKDRNAIRIKDYPLQNTTLDIVGCHLEIGKRYTDINDWFLPIDQFLPDFIHNSRLRIKQLRTLLDDKSEVDVLAGDLNFSPSDPEFDILKTHFRVEKYITDIPETNIHQSVTDFILLNKSKKL